MAADGLAAAVVLLLELEVVLLVEAMQCICTDHTHRRRTPRVWAVGLAVEVARP